MTTPSPESSVPMHESHIEAPQLIHYSADMFAPDSLGREHFPALLEGFVRPNFLNDVATERPNSVAQNFLKNYSFTYNDIFGVTAQDMADLTPSKQKRLAEVASSNAAYVQRRYMHTPYGSLLLAGVGPRADTVLPVAAADEQLLADELQALIESRLEPRDRYIIDRRFGLTSWKAVTSKTISSEVGLTPARIDQITHTFLSALVHPNVNYLSRFTTNPIDSFAADLGMRYEADIPDITEPFIEAAGFTPEEKEEVLRHYGFYRPDPRIEYNELGSFLSRQRSKEVNKELHAGVLEKTRRYVRAHKANLVFGEDLGAMTVPYNPEQLALEALVKRYGRSIPIETARNHAALLAVTFEEIANTSTTE